MSSFDSTDSETEMNNSQLNESIKSSQQNNNQRNITIFDWDDTIMYTSTLESILSGSQVKMNSFSINAQECQSEAYCLLESAIQKGTVFIVTNASLSWIVYCCKYYMPKLIPLLHKIQIFSCRDCYEMNYPNQENIWKTMAFNDILQMEIKNTQQVHSVISIGDSINERNALLSFCKDKSLIIPKSVKLMEKPNIDLLCKELQFIHSQLNYLVTCTSKIDFQLRFNSV